MPLPNDQEHSEDTLVPNTERRSVQRYDALIGVRLRRPGETWFTSRITDLSETGFRMESFVRLHPGMVIWVMFPGFDGRRATVIWATAEGAGCRFEAALHPAILGHLLTKGVQ